jgi:hypothetical protein
LVRVYVRRRNGRRRFAVDSPTFAALLGHTNIRMTMQYVHPAEEHKREAAGKIENFKAISAIKLAEKSHGVLTISTTAQ